MIKREDESVTAFTIRRMRAEIIEECITTAEKAWPMGNWPAASENSDYYRGQDHSAKTVIKALRKLLSQEREVGK